MNDLDIKIKYIYSRYIIILLSNIIICSLFNIVFFQPEIIPLNVIFYEVIIPLLLPLPALIFWLRPRLKLLRFKTTGRNNPITGYLFIAWLCIVFPTAISQGYITEAVGTLIPLKTINNLDKTHLSKFYTLNRYYLDKLNAVIYADASVSGKHNQNLDLEIYAAVPIYEKHISSLWDSLATPKLAKDSSILIIFDGMPISKQKLSSISPKEIASYNKIGPQRGFELYRQAGTHGVLQITSKKIGPKLYQKSILGYKQPKAWLAWKQTKTLDNRLSKNTKSALMNEFMTESKKKFENSDLNGFKYLAKIGMNKDRSVYTESILNADKWETGKPVIFSPIYIPFEKRGRKKLILMFVSLAGGSLIFFFMIMLRAIMPIKVKLLQDKLAKNWQ